MSTYRWTSGKANWTVTARTRQKARSASTDVAGREIEKGVRNQRIYACSVMENESPPEHGPPATKVHIPTAHEIAGQSRVKQVGEIPTSTMRHAGNPGEVIRTPQASKCKPPNRHSPGAPRQADTRKEARLAPVRALSAVNISTSEKSSGEHTTPQEKHHRRGTASVRDGWKPARIW